MRDRTSNFFVAARRHFSRQSLLLAALFLTLLTVSILVGADGLLAYFKIIAGQPLPTLETGGVLFLVTAVAFLAMGMSINAEDMAREKAAKR